MCGNYLKEQDVKLPVPVLGNWVGSGGMDPAIFD